MLGAGGSAPPEKENSMYVTIISQRTLHHGCTHLTAWYRAARISEPLPNTEELRLELGIRESDIRQSAGGWSARVKLTEVARRALGVEGDVKDKALTYHRLGALSLLHELREAQENLNRLRFVIGDPTVRAAIRERGLDALAADARRSPTPEWTFGCVEHAILY
jgi:hypothetical protein